MLLVSLVAAGPCCCSLLPAFPVPGVDSMVINGLLMWCNVGDGQAHLNPWSYLALEHPAGHLYGRQFGKAAVH